MNTIKAAFSLSLLLLTFPSQAMNLIGAAKGKVTINGKTVEGKGGSVSINNQGQPFVNGTPIDTNQNQTDKQISVPAINSDGTVKKN